MRAETRGRPPHRRLGILAGGGKLPREIAESALARGVPVHIVAIDGEADDGFAGLPHTVVGWGQIGHMIAAFRKAEVTDLVIVGRVRRPDLKRLRPDLGFILGLPEIVRLVASGGGDDGVLRGVIRFFERRKFRVVGPAAVAPEVLIPGGAFGKLSPSPVDQADIALGFEIVEKLGAFDIGQGVVVADGRLLAIEAAENTDAMLGRVSRCRRQQGLMRRTPSGVLVKRPKPGQDLRIDLPAVGPRTVVGAAEANLKGIAVMANAVVAAERSELPSRLNAAQVFLFGVEGATERAPRAEAQPDPSRLPELQILAGAAPSDAQTRDVDKGRRAIAVLEPYAAGRAVLIARGHVLAVEADEGAAAAIRRGGALRQWGQAQSKRRSGIAVLSNATELNADVLAAAEEARLAAVAIVVQPGELTADGTRLASAAPKDLAIWAVRAGGRETA